jgi:hypothetical protein
MKDMPQIKQNGTGLEIVPVNGHQTVLQNVYKPSEQTNGQAKEQTNGQVNGHHQNGHIQNGNDKMNNNQCTCPAKGKSNYLAFPFFECQPAIVCFFFFNHKVTIFRKNFACLNFFM